MGETTNTTNGRSPEEQAVWDAAVAASAEQRPDDPPPRYFIEELDVELSAKGRLEAAIKCEDVRDLIEDFDLETKAEAAQRKAERAKLLAQAKDLGSQARTGRVRAKVRCAEYTSFAQNRKFKVRLDKKNPDGTHVEIGETPLSTAERQGKLPLEADAAPNAEEADLSDVDDLDEGEDYDDADDDGDEEPPPSGDSTNNITDPDALIAGSAPDPDAPKTAKRTSRKKN